jgi:predicted transcriptional regulator
MMALEANMSAVKTEAIRLIEGLPETSDWIDVAYRLYVRAKIEQGFADARSGNVVPHDQVMREMDEWLSSLGQPQPSPTSDES